MRYCYALFLVLALAGSSSANAYRGFLLTKDNHQLTGYFNLIEYSPTGNFITFTNDFGDVYSIHPMLVKGFGFSQDGQSVRFISRFHDGQWFFLREVEAGRPLSLFSLPNSKDQYVDDTVLRLFAEPPPTFWIESSRNQLLPIPRVGYKRTLRRFMEQSNPSLASRIGKKGYRYKNLPLIIAEFNATAGRRRLRL